MTEIERRATPPTPARRKRPKREVESADMAPFIERMARAMVKRAHDGDLDALAALVSMTDAMQTATRDAGAALHGAPFRYSWTEIGAHLGVSRQAAQKRFS